MARSGSQGVRGRPTLWSSVGMYSLPSWLRCSATGSGRREGRLQHCFPLKPEWLEAGHVASPGVGGCSRSWTSEASRGRQPDEGCTEAGDPSLGGPVPGPNSLRWAVRNPKRGAALLEPVVWGAPVERYRRRDASLAVKANFEDSKASKMYSEDKDRQNGRLAEGATREVKKGATAS